MLATKQLNEQGQSLWLDNITRDLLTGGTLKRYIEEWSVTGLTSNPTIFDHAIRNGTAYDTAIDEAARAGHSGETLFFEIALKDITQAADLFRKVHDLTAGVDGWVSLEVSPLLAHDAVATLAQAQRLHAAAGRPNLYIKIPGTVESLPAIEEAIYAGIPVNVTLLFSPEHYLAAAEAWLRGVERRIAKGLNPCVSSVASLFISRWDVSVAGKAPKEVADGLGIAIAQSTFKEYSALLGSARWRRVMNAGARPQRLLFASTGTKDPNASDTFYVRALAAPLTVNTMPEGTLIAFADHGELDNSMTSGGGNSADVLRTFRQAGIDITALGARLQEEAATSFVASWNELLGVIAAKTQAR
jgi:transaldolase